MKINVSRFSSLILPAILFVFTANSFGQSVADVARRERERQRATRSKVVVLNNGTTTTATPLGATPAATAAAGTAEAPTGPTDKNGHDEKYWRAAFQKVRDDAKRAEDKATIADLKVKDLNTQLLRQSDVYNRENRIGADLTAAQKELDDARKAADEAKKKITDLEDELRKSGGPAGWAR